MQRYDKRLCYKRVTQLLIQTNMTSIHSVAF